MYQVLKPLIMGVLAIDDRPMEEPAGSRHETVLRFRAAPAFLRYQLAVLAIGMCVFGLPLLGLNVVILTDGPFWLALILDIGAVLLSTAIYFVILVDYDLRTYMVTDRSLRIREGCVWVREMTLTFANIQNVRITQGPLERILGIQTLLVETAGGGASGPHGQHASASFHTGQLRGINNAEEIRTLIRKRMESATTAALVEQETQSDELALYQGILAATERLEASINMRGHKI